MTFCLIPLTYLSHLSHLYALSFSSVSFFLMLIKHFSRVIGAFVGAWLSIASSGSPVPPAPDDELIYLGVAAAVPALMMRECLSNRCDALSTVCTLVFSAMLCCVTPSGKPFILTIIWNLRISLGPVDGLGLSFCAAAACSLYFSSGLISVKK